MRIVETIYPERYGPREILAYLKNSLMHIFWKNNTAIFKGDNQEYIHMNRQFSQEIESMFDCLYAEHRFNSHITSEMKSQSVEVDKIITYRLASSIAARLIENKDIVVCKYRDHKMGQDVYQVGIPFLKRDYFTVWLEQEGAKDEE